MGTLSRGNESKLSLYNEDPPGENCLLRVQLPNDMTTVIQVQADMTMWELLCVISSKKQLTPSRHEVKIMFMNGKSVMADESKTLNSYPDVERVILQKKPDAPGDSSGNLARMRQGRRSSVVLNAPKPSNIRMSSQEFPKTVTDEAALALRLAGSKDAAGLLSKNKKTIKNVAMLLFNKKPSGDLSTDGSSSSLLDSSRLGAMRKDWSQDYIPNEGEDLRRLSRVSTSSRAGDSPVSNMKASPSQDGASFSLRSSDSDLDTLYDGTNTKPLGSHAQQRRASTEQSGGRPSITFSRSLTSNGIFSLADEGASDDPISESGGTPTPQSESNSAASTPAATMSRSNSTVRDPQSREKIRKRTVSSPATSGTSNYATLRRPVMRSNRQRSCMDMEGESDTNIEVGTAPADQPKTEVVAGDASPIVASPGVDEGKRVLLKVSLPDFQSTTIFIGPEQTMETALMHICQKRQLDFEQYTLEVPKEGVIVEMDRTVAFYNQQGIGEVIVVQKEKTYSTMCVNEGGQDVMILQALSGKPQVMAATPAKLIERLTDQDENDKTFMDTLLLTYRSFMTPVDFFDQLVARFNSELPPDPSPEDIEYFNRMKLPTQKRVIATFKWWVQHHYHDFGVDSAVKADLEDFVDQITTYNGGEFAADASELYGYIESQALAYEEMFHNYKNVERKGKTIEGMVQEISVDDLAQQICLHDFKLFNNIHPIEYLNQIWNNSAESSPSMKYFIERFDKESYWAATEIVKEKDLKKRTALLRKFILTGKMCQELNNFFTMFAIIAGLNIPPIQRLKKTWEALPDKAKKSWAELEKMADPSRNMKNYRDTLLAASPPIVPFLPIYLKDLTFMNDGNESKIGTERQMINFDKLRMMGNRVKDISALARIEYNFEPKPPIQNFLSKPPVEKSMAKLKELSLECEKSEK